MAGERTYKITCDECGYSEEVPSSRLSYEEGKTCPKCYTGKMWWVPPAEEARRREIKMAEEKRISPAVVIPIGLGLAAAVAGVGVWLWSRREFIEPRPAIDTILRETIAEEGQPVTEAEIEATLIQAGYSEVEAAAVARRIEGDIIEDAAKALYGVNPLDPLTPGDLAIAEEMRQTILAGDFRKDEEGNFIGSISRVGESTEEFFARQKREKEAYRIYQMSQSEYYRAKWGLEPLAEGEEAVIPTEKVAVTSLEPKVILAAQGEVEEAADAGFTATVEQLEQLESHVGRGDTYEAAVDTAYKKAASEAKETTTKTGVDTVVAWSSDKGYYSVSKSETYAWGP